MLASMDRTAALERLSELSLNNVAALQDSIRYCVKNQIGGFRIDRDIFPFAGSQADTAWAYKPDDLPDAVEIQRRLVECADLAKQGNVRLSIRPTLTVAPLDLASAQESAQLTAQLCPCLDLAKSIGADTVQIRLKHNKRSDDALLRFGEWLHRLSTIDRDLIALQHGRGKTLADQLNFCHVERVPFIYDVTQHRAHPDDLSVEEAWSQARLTFKNDPIAQICSDGDFVDVVDFPDGWRDEPMTIQVEAGQRELAVAKLMRQVEERWYVYILRCADDSLYTGIAKDVDRRLEQHNAGVGAKYTRCRLPVVKVYQEQQLNQSRALKRELAIKALSRDAKETLIASIK